MSLFTAQRVERLQGLKLDYHTNLSERSAITGVCRCAQVLVFEQVFNSTEIFTHLAAV